MKLIQNLKKLIYTPKETICFKYVCDSIKHTPKDLEEKELIMTLQLAEKSLDETNKSFDSNTKKTITIIGFMMTINIGLLSYFLKNNFFSIDGMFSPLLFTALVTCFSFLLLSIYISQSITAKTWYKSGSTPSSFLLPIYLQRKNNNLEYDSYKGMLYNTAINYERNILSNEQKNNFVTTRINTSIYFFVRMPIFSSFLFIFSYLINHSL